MADMNKLVRLKVPGRLSRQSPSRRVSRLQLGRTNTVERVDMLGVEHGCNNPWPKEVDATVDEAMEEEWP